MVPVGKRALCGYALGGLEVNRLGSAALPTLPGPVGKEQDVNFLF